VAEKIMLCLGLAQKGRALDRCGSDRLYLERTHWHRTIDDGTRLAPKDDWIGSGIFFFLQLQLQYRDNQTALL
jgi:hypothetical protein